MGNTRILSQARAASLVGKRVRLTVGGHAYEGKVTDTWKSRSEGRRLRPAGVVVRDGHGHRHVFEPRSVTAVEVLD